MRCIIRFRGALSRYVNGFECFTRSMIMFDSLLEKSLGACLAATCTELDVVQCSGPSSLADA